MTGVWRAAAVSVLALTACRDSQADLAVVMHGPTAIAREARLQAALADPDSAEVRGQPLAAWQLPHALQEISGLALTSDGRLLVHDDEIGAVWEVDHRRGIVVKRFELGSNVVKGDFEGLTVANDVLYLLAGNGKLYEFHEGANGARVKYTVHDTKLTQECEFEGVAFDPAINALLMACKHVHTKALRTELVIYRWSLTDTTQARITKLTVPLASIIGTNGWTALSPSDITVDPLTGNYVLVASLERAVFSITPGGEVVFARPLPAGHEQPEGVAITKDGVLIVSDEARLHPARITLYRWP